MDNPSIDELRQQITDTQARLVLAEARAHEAEQCIARALLVLAIPVPETAADWGARAAPSPAPADPDEPAGDAELGSMLGKEIGGPRTPPAEVG